MELAFRLLHLKQVGTLPPLKMGIEGDLFIPFALQISAVPNEAPGCSAPHLTLGEGPAWSWQNLQGRIYGAL